MNIRSATIQDGYAIAELSGQLGYPSTVEEIVKRLRLIGNKTDHGVFVAELPGGDIAGWVHVLIEVHLESGTFAEIAGLVVEEHHRGIGIGRKLVEAAEHWASGKGCASVRVRTNVIRKETHKFYERVGYEVMKKQSVFQKLLV